MDLNLYKGSNLFITPSRFYIQPNDQKNEALIIDRESSQISLNTIFSLSNLPANTTSLAIDGIIGIKRFIDIPYLIVITNKDEVGTIEGAPVYRMTEWKIFPFREETVREGNDSSTWESIYLGMIHSVLETKYFYFSYDYDLTNTLHRRIRNNSITRKHLGYDRRFLWNDHLMKDFDTCGTYADKYRLPFILGFVNISQRTLGPNLSWILISRRSTLRAGTRFNTRGIDNEGNVANFVETEQIVEDLNGVFRSSFLQVRGSIPLVWRQTPDYSWKPKIEIDTQYDHDSIFKKHFNEINTRYGQVTIVNLLDSTGHEAILAQQFGIRKNNLHYHYFDFHKMRKQNPNSLNQLVSELMPDLKDYGFFAITNGNIVSEQVGVVRTNCVDCLDRTNVVQTVLAEKVLYMQLEKFDCIPRGSSLSQYSEFMHIFRGNWSDNADMLSIQYAGTPALKTDITRYGKRSITGAMNDGINSLTRYVANNFQDNYRQDAIDLFLGRYEGYPSPMYRPWTITDYSSISVIVAILLLLYVAYNY